MRQRTLILAASIASLALLGGCSLQRLAVGQTASVLKAGALGVESETDAQFAEEALPGNLKMMETFLEVDPENEDLLFLCAKGYASYVFLFIEDRIEVAALSDELEWKEVLAARGRSMYDRARGFSFRLLDWPELKEAALGGTLADFEKVLKDADGDHVESLFWLGYAWAGLINLSKDNPDTVAQLPKVSAIMARVEQLDERYFFAGPHLVLGAIAAFLPPALGGKPEVAKLHLEKALGFTEGKFLLVQYMMARFYAVQVQDHALFRKLMQQVLDAPADINRPANLPNAMAKRRARRWLNRMDDLFANLPEEAPAAPAAEEETLDDDATSDF